MRNLLMLSLMMMLLSACGSSSSIPVPAPAPAHAPSISNLAITDLAGSPTATVGSGYGQLPVIATFKFSDSGADVSTVTILWTEPTSSRWSSDHHWTETYSANRSGQTTGDGYMYIGELWTTTAFVYNIELYVTDSTGADSNHLTGTFTMQ